MLPSMNYEAFVFSFNSKGRGDPVQLSAATLRLPEKQLNEPGCPFWSVADEEEHEFMRKRQLVSTIETRTSPSRSLLQPGPYPGYCTLRNGGMPLQDLGSLPTKAPVRHTNYNNVIVMIKQQSSIKHFRIEVNKLK
ncbi:unnamed protein product [Nesidiocoris tenuis]|uniref:Uncharacterized protein n=1 Tax=Nesidiocoris tenuis TaxID=355587 RepID=A0A6H5FW27_9HEMI|nr:unnamed protein product [Nesidiocoris tenuis]